jgi:uncharacterized protein (TIGR02145 family)
VGPLALIEKLAPMNKMINTFLLLTLTVSVVSCKKEKSPEEKKYFYSEAVDIENNKYITVDIDGEMWFTENLSSKLFRNGDTIIEARTNEEWYYAIINGIPAWCYANNDSIISEKHGLIYNYHAVKDTRGLAPAGWHISTSNEWQKLINNYGGEWNAGSALKSTSGWDNDGNGSNITKFSALPSGYRISGGSFMSGIGEYGWWWTSTPLQDLPGNYAVLLPSINNLVNIVDTYVWDYGFFVRCVKD